MRKSGILMHITSLPSPYGVGTLGKCAYEFVDFLQAAGQSFWQILPLNPTGFGNSPYQSFSTFAGNPYLIDPDLLVQQGLLTAEEVQELSCQKDPRRVDFGCLYENRTKLLRKAFERFRPDREYDKFLHGNKDWLVDYAMFMAAKERFRGRPWQSWSMGLMMRIPEVLEGFFKNDCPEIRFQYFQQFLFFRQWQALRSYANSKGIRIIGDIPIYVPLDSADVWANPDIFQLAPDRRPAMVAGCPPDSFSANGQLWGNPLYRWDRLKENGYQWWVRRLKAAARMYDVVRLDHFRGFESYWAIPAGASSAAEGSWQKGPGLDFIRTIREKLPDLQFIAEDLGYVTPEVQQLLEQSGYPGMKVLQFAFDSREQANYLPHGYPVNSVCYSGTHDNPTLMQWWQELAPQDRQAAIDYLGLHEPEGVAQGMIRGCMSSVSFLAIVQLQDYLELGAEARMNCPGILSDQNWTWRALPEQLTGELAEKIRKLTARYERL